MTRTQRGGGLLGCNLEKCPQHFCDISFLSEGIAFFGLLMSNTTGLISVICNFLFWIIVFLKIFLVFPHKLRQSVWKWLFRSRIKLPFSLLIKFCCVAFEFSFRENETKLWCDKKKKTSVPMIDRFYFVKTTVFAKRIRLESRLADISFGWKLVSAILNGIRSLRPKSFSARLFLSHFSFRKTSWEKPFFPFLKSFLNSA